MPCFRTIFKPTVWLAGGGTYIFKELVLIVCNITEKMVYNVYDIKYHYKWAIDGPPAKRLGFAVLWFSEDPDQYC